VWDSRLDQRGTELREATVQPGQGHWRLVRAVWYDEQESQGMHHIFVDTLDANGQRITGVPIRFYWNQGELIRPTEAKPGEPYALDFGMYVVAPSYGAYPNDGHPADDVWGMGIGSIELPFHTIHSSYGLTWQWVIQPSGTPSATATPVPPTATPVPPTPTPTPSGDYLFNRAELVRCDPNAGVTYVEGHVRQFGSPVNGYRVAFSYAADGPIVASILSGPHEGYTGWNPGFYSHILQAGGPREGDWWFWIVDGQNNRISEMAHVRTDGQTGPNTCQQAVIDFDRE
jgi:hypothetical protein